jgi:membrane protein
MWPGALATAVFFELGKWLVGMYLGRASVSSPYGAAGSFVIVLLWVYYAAQIFFFGAELTHVFASRAHEAEVVRAGATDDGTTTDLGGRVEILSPRPRRGRTL